MDRPIHISDMRSLGAGGNFRTIEAYDHATLENLVNAQFAAWATSGHFYPYISDWEVAGGGGGAAYRVTLGLSRNVDWGINVSVSAAYCRFRCRMASSAAECDVVTGQLLSAINTENPNAYVWGVRITGSGRDGNYLVCVLYSIGGSLGGQPTFHLDAYAPVGPFVGATVVLSMTLPDTLGSTPATQRTWCVDYSMEVEDTTGAAGVVADFNIDLATRFSNNWSAPAGSWRTFSGHYYFEQQIGTTTQFDLSVTPVGANVSARACCMTAHLIHNQYSLG